MIYSFPLDYVEAEILRQSGITIDLNTGIFSVNGELRSIEPNERFVDPGVWFFSNGDTIMGKKEE